jgi:hypothetical protein
VLWSEEWQNSTKERKEGVEAVLATLFIGPKQQRDGLSGKVNGGRRVRFEVGRFEDEGEATGRLQFVAGEEERRCRRISFSVMKGARDGSTRRHAARPGGGSGGTAAGGGR